MALGRSLSVEGTPELGSLNRILEATGLRLMIASAKKAASRRDKKISATEAARSFSEVLNQVQYRDTSFSIERGRKVVARLVLPALPAGLALADLNRLFAGLPHLGPAEASQWRAEVRTLRRARRPQTRKWA